MVSQLLMDVAQLPHDVAVCMCDRMQLVESEQGLLVLANMHIHQAKIVNRLQAVSTDTNSFEINLLGTLELVVHEHAVRLVHQSPGIVAVCFHSNVGILLGIRVVCLQEIEERKVCGGARHQRWIFSLKFPENRDG